MSRKSYQKLLEEQIRIKEQLKKAKEKEAVKIGNYILKNEEITSLNDYKKFKKEDKALINKGKLVEKYLKKLNDEELENVLKATENNIEKVLEWSKINTRKDDKILNNESENLYKESASEEVKTTNKLAEEIIHGNPNRVHN